MRTCFRAQRLGAAGRVARAARRCGGHGRVRRRAGGPRARSGACFLNTLGRGRPLDLVFFIRFDEGERERERESVSVRLCAFKAADAGRWRDAEAAALRALEALPAGNVSSAARRVAVHPELRGFFGVGSHLVLCAPAIARRRSSFVRRALIFLSLSLSLKDSFFLARARFPFSRSTLIK